MAKVYDHLKEESQDSLGEAQRVYEEAMESEDLLGEIKESKHYTLDPDMTYISMLKAVKNNSFSREKLQAAFNRLPSNMFYNTSIPTCIVVLKKHREGHDVLFIDASKLYEKEKKQNVMRESILTEYWNCIMTESQLIGWLILHPLMISKRMTIV